MNWTDIVLAIVAAYGAILSTITAVLQWRKARPAVAIDVKHGPGEKLILNMFNPRHKAVTIESPYLYLPDGRTLPCVNKESDVRFPHTLESEEGRTILFDKKELTQQMRADGYTGAVELTPVVKDQVGRAYKGGTISFHVEGCT